MIKIGIIGLGNIGLAHAKTIFSGQVEGMTLAGICDIDTAKQELSNTLFPGVPFFHSHEDLLAADIEAVIISVPHPLHAKLSIAAFQANKHVLVEKPADITVSKARKMNEALAEAAKIAESCGGWEKATESYDQKELRELHDWMRRD